MENEISPLEASIQEQLNSDTDFQEEIELLSDEEKEVAISKKERELYKEAAKKLADEAEKAREIAKNQEIRAKKAEAKAEPKKPTGEESAPKMGLNGLSVKDVLSLRDVHEDDVDYILEEAKLRGKSPSEIKKDPYMQIILKTRAEERQTAEVTNTGKAKRGSGKMTAEQIVDSAHSGKEIDPSELAEAEMALKLKRLKQ